MIEKMIDILCNWVRRWSGRSGTQPGREYLSRARAGARSRSFRSAGPLTHCQCQYPSSKMGVNIPHESALDAEFMRQCESSPKVKEYYPQGPRLNYRYRAANGLPIWASMVPDFVVIEADRVVLVETNTEQAMCDLIRRFPGRYAYKYGRWTSPPAAKVAAKLGFDYEIHTELQTDSESSQPDGIDGK